MAVDTMEMQMNMMDQMQVRKTNKKTQINLNKIEAFLSQTKEGKLIFNNINKKN